MRKIPNKVVVQARVKPATRKELERQASKAGMRLCSYLAQEIERMVAPREKPQWPTEIVNLEAPRLS